MALEHTYVETGDYGVVLDSEGRFGTDFLWVAETMIVMHDEVYTVGGVAQMVDRGGATARVDFFDGYSGDVPIVEGREALEGSLPIDCDGGLLTFEFDAGLEMPFHRTKG